MKLAKYFMDWDTSSRKDASKRVSMWNLFSRLQIYTLYTFLYDLIYF